MHERMAPTVDGASDGFDEAAYRAWNPDVDAAVRAGEWESGRSHFERAGAHERRLPFVAPAPSCTSPLLRPGDVAIQTVRTAQDWWAAAGFAVATHGGLARVTLECAVLRGPAREVAQTFRFDEWAADGERLVLKFPPLERSRDVALALRIEVRALEGAERVQFLCEPTGEGDGLEWNGATPAAARIKLELLHTPPLLPGPRGITLNPMTHCEAECIHCLSRSHHQRPGSLKKEWIEALRGHFRDGPGAAWCIDYATDFFRVASYRPELIELLRQKGAVSINTDGQSVTRDLLQRMMAVDLLRIGFSCDAATEETYSVVRKGLGKLENVLAAARLAVELRRELGRAKKPCLALSMVTMQANVREMVRLVELAAEVGVDAVWFNQLWVCEPAVVEQSLMFTPEVWREEWTRAERRGRELGVEVCQGADLRPEHPQGGVTWCPEPWSAMVVLGNGDVLACASPASKIGSLREQTIDEIWNGAAFQELRRRVNGDDPPLICQHCFVYRKPGNADGVFMHHLTDGYDLRRDLFEPGYAEEFRQRFSFARAREEKAAGVKVAGANGGGCCGGGACGGKV